MNIFVKQLLIIILIIFSVLGIYFGAYLPWVKSQAYITALKTISGGGVQSLGDYLGAYDKAVKLYSPIGEEEITKFLSTDIMNVIVKQNQSEEVTRALVDYVEPLLFKNNVRHLLAGGQMHFILWKRFNKEEDYTKAEDYYLAARAIGPKLPPVLYELLNLYKEKLKNDFSQVLKKSEPEQMREFFRYTENMDELVVKVVLWGHHFLPRYFNKPTPDFHYDLVKIFFLY